MQIKNEQSPSEKPDYTDEKPKQTQKTSKSKEPYRDHSRERHNEIVALLNDIKNILSEINEHQSWCSAGYSFYYTSDISAKIATIW